MQKAFRLFCRTYLSKCMPAGRSEILPNTVTASSKGKPNIVELLMSSLLELDPIPY